MYKNTKKKIVPANLVIQIPQPVAYFTKEVSLRLAKLPLNFNGSLAKLGLPSF